MFLFPIGRHSAPTNATSIAINATSSLLTWQPPDGVQPQLLSFVVKISDMAGVDIYNVTAKGLQTVINLPNPCDTYEAWIRPQCPNQMPINNDTVDLHGGKYIACLYGDLFGVQQMHLHVTL